MSMVGAAPIAVGKGVGKGVFAGGKGIVHGVGFGVGFAGRRIGLLKKKDKHGDEVLVDERPAVDPVSVEETIPSTITEEPLDPLIRAPSPSYQEALPAGNGKPAEQTRQAKDPSIYGDAKMALSVTCIRGRDIVGTASGDIKPYISLQIGKKSHKTEHAKKSEEPEW